MSTTVHEARVNRPRPASPTPLPNWRDFGGPRAPKQRQYARGWHATGVLLAGGTVIDVDGERPAEVRIGTDGRIAATGAELVAEPGESVVDCAGRFVIPGGVDVHTHLHLPVGQVRVSDDFDTGTRAAAIGGTTTHRRLRDRVPGRGPPRGARAGTGGPSPPASTSAST